MEIIYLLIPISIILVLIIGLVLSWAIKSGQYEDLDSEGEKILFEEDEEVN